MDRPVLSISHDGGLVSSFEPLETELQLGDAVSGGEQIGTLSSYHDGTAHCAQPCLHWGVRLHGEYINPLLMLGPLDPSVLLPLK